MALWNSVDHFEKYKITDESQVELFVKSWPDILTENTDFNFDWRSQICCSFGNLSPE